jgi:DNA-binding transcriptional LysR family regulator
MEAAAWQMERLVKGKEARISGTIRISASPPIACYVLPEILTAMRQTLPGIQVELVASAAVSNLLRREADIAVRMVQPVQASLRAKRLGAVEIGAYAHSSYLARRGMPHQVQDLLQHELIGLDRADDILRGFAASGVTVTRDAFAFRSDDFIAGFEALRAGLGIGFIATYMARRDPELRKVLPNMPRFNLPVWLVVHHEIETNARVRAVYNFLAKQIPKALRK